MRNFLPDYLRQEDPLQIWTSGGGPYKKRWKKKTLLIASLASRLLARPAILFLQHFFTNIRTDFFGIPVQTEASVSLGLHIESVSYPVSQTEQIHDSGPFQCEKAIAGLPG